MYEVELFRDFNSKHGVRLKDRRDVKKLDNTRVDTTYTLNFDKHPNLDKSSGGGRLEQFNSVFADSTSVYEVSHRLYISFKTISEGKAFLDNLRSQLQKVSWKEIPKKTDAFDEYEILGKEFLDSNGKPKTQINTRYPCSIVLRLTPNRETNGCELYIGL